MFFGWGSVGVVLWYLEGYQVPGPRHLAVRNASRLSYSGGGCGKLQTDPLGWSHGANKDWKCHPHSTSSVT